MHLLRGNSTRKAVTVSEQILDPNFRVHFQVTDCIVNLDFLVIVYIVHYLVSNVPLYLLLILTISIIMSVM